MLRMTGGTTVIRLAYDWIGGNIYFTTNVGIGLCHSVSQLCTVIVQGDVAPEPLGIAVYPKVGKLFWSNVNSFASV